MLDPSKKASFANNIEINRKNTRLPIKTHILTQKAN